MLSGLTDQGLPHPEFIFGYRKLGCRVAVYADEFLDLRIELDMDAFKPLKSRTNRFGRVPEYPMNEYDISFLVDSSVKWSEITAAVLPKKSDDNLLRDVLFVDEYKGKQIPEGKKSITLRLVIGSDEKTLTGPEIEAVANSARKKLGKAFGADVRTV